MWFTLRIFRAFSGMMTTVHSPSCWCNVAGAAVQRLRRPLPTNNSGGSRPIARSNHNEPSHLSKNRFYEHWATGCPGVHGRTRTRFTSERKFSQKKDDSKRDEASETPVGKSESMNTDAEKTIPSSLQERFRPFHDSESHAILDVEELRALRELKEEMGDEEEQFSIYQEKRDPLRGYSFDRGSKGVYDMEELVNILKMEKAGDITVISIPPEFHYVDYMVIVTSISQRHLQAMSGFIKKLYKRKKADHDPWIVIEGRDCKDWKVLDMGNIVLHMFLPETRKLYDLESLWSVGSEYDDQIQRSEVNAVFEAIKMHTSYLHDIHPLDQVNTDQFGEASKKHVPTV